MRRELALDQNVAVMGITGMVATFGNVLWFFFLPIYYVRVFGLSPLQVSYIYAVWLALTAIGSAPAGALADRFGRKNVIVLSSLVSSISAFIFAFSANLLLSALAFALQGVGQALFQVSNTLVAESIERERRGTAFGSYMMFTQILAAFSPAIGGAILQQGSGNYFLPLFFIGGVLTLVAAVSRFFFVRETLPFADRKPLVARGSVQGYLSRFQILKNNRFLLTLVLIYSMYNLVVDQNSFITPLYVKFGLGVSQLGTGIVFSLLLGASVIARLPFGKLADKIGRRRTIILSWVGEIGSIFIFILAPKGDLEIAIPGIVVWMIFGVMDGPAINAWIAEASDPKNRGLSMGVFYSAAFLATVPALLVSGYLFTIAPQLPFYVNAFLSAIALLLLITFVKGDLPPPHRIEEQPA